MKIFSFLYVIGSNKVDNSFLCHYSPYNSLHIDLNRYTINAQSLQWNFYSLKTFLLQFQCIGRARFNQIAIILHILGDRQNHIFCERKIIWWRRSQQAQFKNDTLYDGPPFRTFPSHLPYSTFENSSLNRLINNVNMFMDFFKNSFLLNFISIKLNI